MPRILVVDDDPLISMLVEDWLTELGYRTIGPAGSVSSALRLLESTPVDAAILDVSVGGEDSYPVAEVLSTRGIPFAFATGYGPDGVADRFRTELTLSKPFDFEAFKNTVGQLLEPSPH